MRIITRAVVALSLAAVAMVGVGASPSSAATSSGWNNWSCKPSAKHPNPVVLAHGLGANDVENFVVLAPQLVAQGYCVYSTTYGGTILGNFVAGLGPMDQSAQTLSNLVDKVLAQTGATKVDIVGHSEGTTVPAYYLKFLGGDTKVGTFIGFGANFAGTSLSGLGTLGKALNIQPLLNGVGCGACSQFLIGSDFLKKLNAGGVAVPGPKYVAIVSKLDKIVTPYTSGLLTGPNTTNVVLQDRCILDRAGHLGQAIDPNVAGLVKHYLDPTRVPSPACVPFFGGGI